MHSQNLISQPVSISTLCDAFGNMRPVAPTHKDNNWEGRGTERYCG